MAPPGQTVVADDDGINQLVGTDPGPAGFRDEPDPAGLCAAPGVTIELRENNSCCRQSSVKTGCDTDSLLPGRRIYNQQDFMRL